MNAFMMYMMGGQIGIFSIMMLGMSMFRVLSSVASVKQVSKGLETSENYYLQMLCWLAGQVAVVLLCAWKCNNMGLLPTHPSDWLTFATPAEPLEYSAHTLL